MGSLRPSALPIAATADLIPLADDDVIALTDDLIIDSTPRTLGPYELIAEIARGGMGVVYLCRRAGAAGFERLFAIKEMHPHLAHDRGFVAMLLDEGRLAARIHHHNVASVLEVGRTERGHYLVMPYVEGCSLAQLLARNPAHRPPALLVPIMIGALNGLHAAHSILDADGRAAGLVHRDVSPQNILIGIDGDARITDFGIARARARIASTEPGQVKGKLGYIAPEIIEGAAAVDHRADQFSAGVVLWNALTGRSLFRGDSDADTLRRVLTLPVAPPSQVGLAPPAAFDRVVLTALARDPAQRFASAGAMAEALRDAALAAGLLGAPTRVARWVCETFAADLDERHRLIRAAGTALEITVLPAFSPGPECTPSAAPAPAADPAPMAAEPPSTPADVVRFLVAVGLAFLAGTLLTLYARGML